MATQHDDPNHPRRPQPPKPQPKKETDLAKEGEEVIDGDFEALDHEHGPLTNPRQTGPATWIAPYQEDAPDAETPKALEPPPPGGYTRFPSLSLDEPHPPEPALPPSEVAEETAEVLDDDEPVIAEPASTASSTVHVAEIIDDVAEDDVEVLSDEPTSGNEESSVVDISALVDEGSSNVVEDVTPGSSSVLSDSAVVVDSPLEPTSAAEESSAILAEPASEVAHDVWADVSEVPTPTPESAVDARDPMPSMEATTSHASDEVLGGEAEDLDSAVLVDPSSVAQVKTEISQPAPVASLDDKEPDIDWDEITAAGDSKVAPGANAGDGGQTLVSGMGSAPVIPVAPDSAVVADEAVIAQADSGTVELGGSGAAKPPIAGVDPVAEAVESGVNLGPPAHQGDKSAASQNDDTELHTEPIDENDSVFDEDILEDGAEQRPEGEHAKSADDEAAALYADDSGNTPRPAQAAPTEVGKDVEFDEDSAKEHHADAKDAEHVAALAFEDESVQTASKNGSHAEADDAVDLGAMAIADDEAASVAPVKREHPSAIPVGASASKSGRGWLTGMLATLLIGAGAIAAVWYAKPDLLEQISKSSPNAVPAKKEKANKSFDDSKLRAELKAAEQNLAALQEKVGHQAKNEANATQGAQQAGAITAALVNAKIVDNKDKVDPATLQKTLNNLGESKSKLAAINKLLEQANVIPGDEQGVAKLIAAKKDVDNKLVLVNKLLADHKVGGEGIKGVEELIAARDELAKDRSDLDQAIGAAYKDLTGAAQPPAAGEPRTTLAEAVNIVRQKGESPLVTPLVKIASAISGLATGATQVFEKAYGASALSAELAYYRLREPLIITPNRQLDDYIRRMQNATSLDPAEARQAAQASAWVLSKGAGASPEARAKALYLAALNDRAAGNVAGARQKLTEALAAGATLKDQPWTKQAAASLQEMTEPSAYFLPRASQLAEQGDFKAAQDVLNRGLKLFPSNARLLSLRGLVRLEATGGDKGQIEAAQQQIRQDAEAVAGDPEASAEAAYVLGLLEEDLGNFDKAEAEFRKAVKANRGSSEGASRYIIALARLLQRERTAAPSAAIPMIDEPAKEKPPGKQEAEPKKEDARSGALRRLLTVLLVGVQADSDDADDGAASARMRESIDLANKLIESANPKVKGQGYMIRGQALSKIGRRTEGMRDYVKGLELLFPGRPSRDLAKLVQEHPAFHQLEAGRPNPLLAEQFYGKGLELFWAQDYPAAEKKFRKAVEFYSQDARYQYFLGMSMLAQGGRLKRDAGYDAFEKASRLEAANRPSMEDVNSSLERIQGSMRDLVNAFRQKALLAAR